MKILILVLFSFFLSKAQADNENYKMERFTETVRITKPLTIKVTNHYGDIRIRKADDDQFIYHGVAQSGKAQAFTLDFSKSGDNLIAEVQFSHPEQWSKQVRYDLALIVPDKAALEIEIARGSLTSKGLNNTIKARSEHADMQLKTSGSVDLFSKTGAIELMVKNNKHKTSSKLQTHQGSVTLKYNTTAPFVSVTSGNHVSSNSAELLNTMALDKRSKKYGETTAAKQIQIITDTGPVALIDVSQQHQEKEEK